VPVPVMYVGVVRMRVPKRVVLVDVYMRFLPVPLRIMRMLMMRVMPMRVAVLEPIMRVCVRVFLAHMQPYA
jgi:hypothetical protein